MNALDQPATEWTCHHGLQNGYFCPECRWFAIGPPQGRTACADCGAMLLQETITPDKLEMTDPFQDPHEAEDDLDSWGKGAKHEKEAMRILKSLYAAHRLSIYGGNDPFHLVDVVGIDAERIPKWVQVKTNGFNGRKKYRDLATLRIPTEYVDFEVWIRYDRGGWEFYRWDGEAFNLYFQVDVCDYQEVREKWKLHVTGGTIERELDAELASFTSDGGDA